MIRMSGIRLTARPEDTVDAREARWKRATTALVFGALAVVWTAQITGSEAATDARTNVVMAVNLSHNGVISSEAEAPYEPSMLREPLPVLTTALSVEAVDALLGTAPGDAYMSGQRVRILKYQNIGWMALLSVAVLFSVKVFTGSHYLALVAVVLTTMAVPLVPSGIGPQALWLDSLFTELPAAALLTSASLLLALGARDGRRWAVVSSGLAFGLLALVKASFLYVFLGLAMTLPIVRALRDRGTWREAFVQMGALSIAFALVVVPWMARNASHFGTFRISDRGGEVLYTRALKNSMTTDEFRASFHFWAPEALRPALGRVLAIEWRDYRLGGPYARLNRWTNSDFVERDREAERSGHPSESVSFWRAARAERTRLSNQFRADGSRHPRTEAEGVLQERALRMIRDQPAKHLLMTTAFLWRGALIPFPVLIIGLAYGLSTKRAYFLAYVLPAFGAVMFFALFSHYIPRYSVPMVPVCIVTGVVAASVAWQTVVGRLERESASRGERDADLQVAGGARV